MPGPIEPSTKRGRSGVENSSAASRAICVPARASSRMRSAMSYSLRFGQLVPKVFVSIDVRAGLEVALVDGEHDVRAGDVEDLVAALEILEVVEGEVLVLQHGAHGAVADEDTLVECGQER